VRNQIFLAILSAVLGGLTTRVYDEYSKPILLYKIQNDVKYTNGLAKHKYTVKLSNAGLRPAEDITCRFSIFGSVKKASSVVNGESKSITPDHPNAVFDKISYLNRGRVAIFEIESEGEQEDNLFVLVIAKGAQAENQATVDSRNKDFTKLTMVISLLSVVIYLITKDRRRSVNQ